MKTIFIKCGLPVILLLEIILPLAAQPLPDNIPYQKGQLWGFADSTGHVTIKPQWYGVKFFSNSGRAVVYPGLDSYGQKDESWKAVIDTSGNYIIPPERHWQGYFFDGFKGLNSHDSSGKWGIIDRFNQEKIPLVYERITAGNSNYYNCFEQNPANGRYYMIVQKNGKQGIIDTLNQTIIPFDYERIFRYKRYGYQDSNCVFVVKRNHKFGLINWHNAVLVPLIYDSVYINRDFVTKGLVYVLSGGKTGIVDTNRNIILPPQYYNARAIFTGRDSITGFQISNKNGDRLGWVNNAGRMLLSPVFRNSNPPEFPGNGMFYTTTGKDKVALFDKNGKLLLPFIYDYVSFRNDTVFASRTTFESKRRHIDVSIVDEYRYANGRLQKAGSRHRKMDYSQLATLLEQRRYFEGYPGGYSPHYIRGEGQDVFYDKDSVRWRVTARVRVVDSEYNDRSQNTYYAVKSSGYDHRAGDQSPHEDYYALINNKEQFLIKPQMQYQILGGEFAQNRLYVRNREGLVALADTNLNLLTAFLPYRSIRSISLQNREYLIAETRQTRKNFPFPGAFDSVPKEQRVIKREEYVYVSGMGMRRPLPQSVQKITDSTGKILSGFGSYDFLGIVDSNGNRNWALVKQYFKGNGHLFLVQDTLTGLVGLLDKSGQVVYPNVSFKYKALQKVNSLNDIAYMGLCGVSDADKKIFQVENTLDQWGFVRASGKVLFPEISFQHYHIPEVLSNGVFYIDDRDEHIKYFRNGERLNGKKLLLNANNQSLFPGVEIYDVEPARNAAGQNQVGIYEIRYYNGNSQSAYMDKYGRVYKYGGL